MTRYDITFDEASGLAHLAEHGLWARVTDFGCVLEVAASVAEPRSFDWRDAAAIDGNYWQLSTTGAEVEDELEGALGEFLIALGEATDPVFCRDHLPTEAYPHGWTMEEERLDRSGL